MVKENIRQCIVSRERLSKDLLIRFVVDPDGYVTPDIRCKLPGRGIWVKATKAFVEKAIKHKQFARGFKQPVSVSEQMPDLIETLLRKDCLARLSLAYRAGDVVIGSAKLLDAIGKKPIIFLLHASEAAEDGCRRLDKKFFAATNSGDVSSNIFSQFSCDQLSTALGQLKVVHIGMKDGNAANRFIRLVKKLECYVT